MILSALTDYDIGFTLEETAARLKKKTHRNVSPSTIASWLEEYKRHCSYRRLRAQGLSRFPANQTIRTIKLYHRQIYSFAYHRPKLDFLRAGVLDDKRKGDTRFAPLADFLERVPTDCPHELFSREGDPKAPRLAGRQQPSPTPPTPSSTSGRTPRPKPPHSSFRPSAITSSATRRFSASCSRTIPSPSPSRFRSGFASTTSPPSRRGGGSASLPKSGHSERVITGHIDFLQVRNGAIHILDYKPDATTNKPFAQLTIYALALSHLTGIPLFDFKCAWFNEHQYCEFFPRTILARNTPTQLKKRAA